LHTDLLNPGTIKSLMKYLMAIALLALFSMPASAQWYRISLKKHERLPLITAPKFGLSKRYTATDFSKRKIQAFYVGMGDFEIEAQEDMIMKSAQHNMRFHVYNVASYDFSALAKLYIMQKRLSEAKWYLLQSNSISREENDDRHTIANLMDLAMIKADMGDISLSQQDLAEARQMAVSHGWLPLAKDVDKEANFIKLNRSTVPQPGIRYADAAKTSSKNNKKAD
jgi:hypothetical protein